MLCCPYRPMGVSCPDGDCDACGWNYAVEETRIAEARARYVRARDASEDVNGLAVTFKRGEAYKKQLEKKEGKA